MTGLLASVWMWAREINELPRSGWGVVGVLILTIPAIATAVTGGFVLFRQGRISSKVGEIKAQVVNGHEDPLRADIDRLIESVAELRGEMRGMTHRLDLLAERRIEQQPFQEERRDHPHRYGR